MAPFIVDKVQSEYREKRKPDTTVKYVNQQENRGKSSVVNPSQMNLDKDEIEDPKFIKLMEEIRKEIGIVE
jgi:hypothetical protein